MSGISLHVIMFTDHVYHLVYNISTLSFLMCCRGDCWGATAHLDICRWFRHIYSRFGETRNTCERDLSGDPKIRNPYWVNSLLWWFDIDAHSKYTQTSRWKSNGTTEMEGEIGWQKRLPKHSHLSYLPVPQAVVRPFSRCSSCSMFVSRTGCALSQRKAVSLCTYRTIEKGVFA